MQNRGHKYASRHSNRNIISNFFISHSIKSGKDRYSIFIILMFSALNRKGEYWKDQVEITPSVRNKKELAREYINTGDSKESLGNESAYKGIV